QDGADRRRCRRRCRFPALRSRKNRERCRRGAVRCDEGLRRRHDRALARDHFPRPCDRLRLRDLGRAFARPRRQRGVEEAIAVKFLDSLVAGIEGSALAEWLRTTAGAIPIIEAAHVMGVALVFGTILIVDLRLLGIPNRRRSFVRTSNELLRYTWLGFGLAAVTGVLMFVANPATYVGNTLFWWKMAALLGAGVNMAVFELVTSRGVKSWDRDTRPPPA